MKLPFLISACLLCSCVAQDPISLGVDPGVVATITVVEDLEAPVADSDAYYILLQAEDGPPSLPPISGDARRARLTILSYDQPLEQFGLAPGPQHVASAGTSRRALPRASSIRSGLLSEGALVEGELPEMLAGLRLASERECPALDIELITIGDSVGNVIHMSALSDGTLLIHTGAAVCDPGQTEHCSPGSPEYRWNTLSDGEPSRPVPALRNRFAPAQFGGVNHTFYVSEGGYIDRFQLDGSGDAVKIETMTASAPPGRNYWINNLNGVDSERPEAREIFALGDRGSLFRIGVGLELIDDSHSMDIEIGRPWVHRALQRLGPGHVLFTSDAQIFERMPDGRVTEADAGIGDATFYMSFAQIPGLGLVGTGLSSENGVLVVKREGSERWQRLELEAAGEELTGASITHAVPFGEGMLLPGERARILHVGPFERGSDGAVTSYGLCKVLTPGLGDYNFAEAWADGSIVFGGLHKELEDRAPAQLVRVRAQP